MDYLTSLNDNQLEAVQTTEGFLRVIAGAGSGKTKLLVSRYAYLVKEYGIDPANILCVTFTNKAAGEMKRRVRAVIGEEYDTSLICTYHGFCVRVLREDIEKIFYPQEFQIIDRTQQKDILTEIYQRYELKLDHASFEKIIKLIALKKSDRKYVEKMCCTDKCQILHEIHTLDDTIVEEFLQYQKKVYAMDFNDLMYFTLYIFEHFPDVLKKWQDKLNYIQVDEFQDSSSTEMELIDLLSGKHKNLMIVGDPDQNIYEWRGSKVELLVDFDKVHIPTKTVFLNQNYRSTPQILTCANTLIEKNRFRLEKDLFTLNSDGDRVFHFHMNNEYAEADKIVETIQSVMKRIECRFADFAVLYRSGFLSRVIEKKFTENGIPYEIYGGVKFYHRMEIQDILAYLRLIAFDDDLSFKRIINTPRRKFGRYKMQRLEDLKNDGKSYYETLKENIKDHELQKSKATELVKTIESIRERLAEMTLSECIEEICAGSGYEKYIRELGDMERFENLSEFKRIAFEYENNFGEEVSLKEFINQISLQSEDNGETECDMVKLMTIHSAKGLEFPFVFVVGFSEGIFPSSKTIEERKEYGLEEERRLCYVAITRAEKRLFLLDSEGYTQNGKEKLPSRFLKEIGEENYVRIGTISKELQESADAFAATLCGESIAGSSKEIGDTVSHPAFGDGVIIGYGKNQNSYRIKFENLPSERDISANYFNKPRNLPAIKSVSAEEEKASPSGYSKVEETKVPEYKAVPSQPTQSPQAQSKADTPDIREYENLWKHENVPKTGWVCLNVTDLGAPVGVCEMCGHQIIRYVHKMYHPSYGTLGVGCVCAGKMEGNPERAKQREQNFKNKESRKETFRNRKWKTSKNNNSYIKVKDHLIVLYYNKNYDNWKYSIDNQFCKVVFESREEAMDAAFEALESILLQ